MKRYFKLFKEEKRVINKTQLKKDCVNAIHSNYKLKKFVSQGITFTRYINKSKNVPKHAVFSGYGFFSEDGKIYIHMNYFGKVTVKIQT